MSGGVEEMFDLNKIRKTNKNDIEVFWTILLQARQKKSVICCNIEPGEKQVETELPNGLVKGHAYVLSTLASMPFKSKELRLVKCINPWGMFFYS